MNTAISHSIILFDGYCNLCSGAVQWIIRHDKKARFRFASLQSQIGIELQEKYTIPATVDSIVLVENNRAYTMSDAALRIARNCDGLWKFWYVFIVLPRFFRDPVYRWIAANRYRWFGKKTECWLPTPELKQRFLEDTSKNTTA